MNSEQLGALVADLVGLPGTAPVRRAAAAEQHDLVCGSVRAVGPGAASAVRDAVAAHPDVERAELARGVLLVRLTDAAVARGLGSPDWTDEDRLRVPDRPFLLASGAAPSAPVAAGEARSRLGDDVVAYHLAREHRRGVRGPVRLDVEAVVSRTPRSPLFVVQHAHARTAMLSARAARLGLGPMGDNRVRDNDVPVLRRGPAGELATSVLELPATVVRAGRRDEVRLVPAHLEEVAGLLDALEPERRFLPHGDGEVTAEHRAGIRLARSVREMLAAALRLLGVSAPTRI